MEEGHPCSQWRREVVNISLALGVPERAGSGGSEQDVCSFLLTPRPKNIVLIIIIIIIIIIILRSHQFDK